MDCSHPYIDFIVYDDITTNIRHCTCSKCNYTQQVKYMFDCIACNKKFQNFGRYVFLNICEDCYKNKPKGQEDPNCINCGEELSYQMGKEGAEIIHYCANPDCKNSISQDPSRFKILQ